MRCRPKEGEQEDEFEDTFEDVIHFCRYEKFFRIPERRKAVLENSSTISIYPRISNYFLMNP